MTRETRRQFLRGAAGFTLALPFLESLANRRAIAGDPPFAAQPRFVHMTTEHGGVWGEHMFPADSAAPNKRTLFTDHVMHHGPLARTVNASSASLSPVLTAGSSKLTEAMVSKMNVIRGLDIMFYISHHTGGHLGNYAATTADAQGEHRPTIDQVLAYSPKFYPSLGSIKERSLHIGTRTDVSWGYTSPDDPQSALQPVPLSNSSLALFNKIFVPEADPDARPLVVDRVVENYRRLRSGAFGDAARLSGKDRRRLDDHMDRLRDLETRLNAVADCSDVVVSTEDSADHKAGVYTADIASMRKHYELFNDVIVAAFMCGTSRIAVISTEETWSTEFPGMDWHDYVAHEASQSAAKEGIMVEANRYFFESVFLDLAEKLDRDEADGMTYLDNSLLVWTQESGHLTHESNSIPVVTAGSGAGYFQTGKYVDYRDRDNKILVNDYDDPNQGQERLRRPGLSYNQWLANVLRAGGLSPSDFEAPGERGYGLLTRNPEKTEAWPQRVLNIASDPLPVLVKG
jgi:hypothetical protein